MIWLCSPRYKGGIVFLVYWLTNRVEKCVFAVWQVKDLLFVELLFQTRNLSPKHLRSMKKINNYGFLIFWTVRTRIPKSLHRKDGPDSFDRMLKVVEPFPRCCFDFFFPFLKKNIHSRTKTGIRTTGVLMMKRITMIPVTFSFDE